MRISRGKVVFGAVMLVLSGISPAAAQDLQPRRIDVEYVEPKTMGLKSVYEFVKQARVLEQVRDLAAPLRLPRRLLIKTDACDGEANAWYENDTVTVCYEYLDEFWKNVPDKPTMIGVTPIDTLVGPMVDLFLHEIGHAVFDYWGTPILGREEDAADQFSTFIMLRFSKEDARRLILGNAYQYKGDIRRPFVFQALRKFSDVHGTPAQRYFNVLCMAYGADPVLFADFVEQALLPKDRAEGCKEEYTQVANAFRKLIDPYVDQDLARELHQNWMLPPADKRPQRRR
jgi:hypothetical protein